MTNITKFRGGLEASLENKELFKKALLEELDLTPSEGIEMLDFYDTMKKFGAMSLKIHLHEGDFFNGMDFYFSIGKDGYKVDANIDGSCYEGRKKCHIDKYAIEDIRLTLWTAKDVVDCLPDGALELNKDYNILEICKESIDFYPDYEDLDNFEFDTKGLNRRQLADPDFSTIRFS